MGIIALIVILLHFSVTAEISADKSGVDFRLKYMFFTIYPRPPKKKKTQKEKPPEEDFSDNLEDDFEMAEEENTPDDEVTVLPEKETEEVENPVLQEKQTENKAEEKKNEKEEKSEEKPQPRKEKKEKEPTENSGRKKGGKLDGIKEKWNMVKPYIPMGWKYFRKLLKKIRFDDVKIHLTVGKEDAYESAMFYGKIQGVLFNLIALLNGIFTVKVREADVKCVFDKKVFDGDVYVVVKIRPSTIISVVVCMGISFLKIFLPQYFRKRKQKKAKNKIQAEENPAT